MRTIFGCSAMLYSGTTYGRKIEGAPVIVRAFDVAAETSRSYVLQNGVKISKKAMTYNAGAFSINMHLTLDDAMQSLNAKVIG